MPVISAYSSSSSYISPSSYRYKSSLSDRRSYATSITSSSGTTGSSFYRRSSYRYDLPSSSSAYSSSSSSYRSTAASDRAADTELSNSLSTLATSSASEVGSSTSNGSKEASRPSRYSSAYGTYGSRISSRSSDGGRSSLKDRENNCYCAVGGAGSSSSYASSLRNTALSGADIYQKYSVSTFSSRPSIYERIAASRPVEKPQPVVSIASASAALDSSKATIKLRPSLNGTAALTNGGGTSTTAKFIATATPAAAPAEDLHVTATIRLKPKPSISQHNSTSSSSNNNNNGIDAGGTSSSSGNSSSDEQDARYRNGNGAKSNGNNNNNEDDGGQSESDDADDDKQEVDKDSKRQPAAADEEKGSYLRTGTASKSIHSTSPVGYRSGRDWDSGITSTSSSNNGTSSSGYRSGLKSGYGQEEDSPRSGGSRKEGLCGLWNIGNTCFMNSVIQCLSHTRELTNYLRNQPTTERGTSKDHKILAEYTKLIKDMWSGTTRSVNPSEMKNAFSSKHRMYSGSAQQDAQEFLRFFIDSLHGGLNVSVKREPISKEIEDDDMPNRVKSAMMWDWYSRVENSMIKDLFVGMLRSTLRCSACNNASVTFDPFWDLSLPLPSTNSRGKLLDCMDEFVREEVMDGLDQVYCSKCKARRRCTKSMAIERFPKYLVIHLKRFSETRWSKLTNVIEFPTGERELNLQQYASEDHQGPVNYSLYGISNHMGSTAGGHYIAVCKHPISKEWNEFNDNFVSETSERSLVTSSAYVLFYERA
ncbi:ubiquitin carboxyl-terminal hydrolase Usp2 isoform X2 [Culex pipiens pallens]|uniref:ubiquitin carboxyl-terminal hydrolase Usp2 isoform X2 n=1 Tax=Culex pipiens pallens TaxID=42434 RepID=UPI0019532174|nr:ubiquitin carboxyl-terminal hydrolase Usp2 isoform X2 [Culex pipiens pallens]